MTLEQFHSCTTTWRFHREGKQKHSQIHSVTPQTCRDEKQKPHEKDAKHFRDTFQHELVRLNSLRAYGVFQKIIGLLISCQFMVKNNAKELQTADVEE